MVAERTLQRSFFGMSALLFATSAALTTAWCGSMASMGNMAMPGGWTMSMAWMRMPGESWPGTAFEFLAMWVVMMVAMMLPSVIPTFWRYRVATGSTKRTTALATGYFAVWAAVGAAIFPAGAALAEAEMNSTVVARSIPLASAVVVIVAGALQFTRWKAQHLAHCGHVPPGGNPWIEGMRLGMHCVQECAGWTAILLVMGVMDLRAMALVTGPSP